MSAQQGLPNDSEGNFDLPALNISYNDALLPHLGVSDVQDAIDVLKTGSGGMATRGFERDTIFAEGSDFTVLIPGAPMLNTNYIVNVIIQSGAIFTTFRIPKADRLVGQFRLISDAQLDNATSLGFILKPF